MMICLFSFAPKMLRTIGRGAAKAVAAGMHKVYGWATGNWTMFGSYNQIIIQFTGETRHGSDAPGEVVNYAVNYRNKILELWREERLVNC